MSDSNRLGAARLSAVAAREGQQAIGCPAGTFVASTDGGAGPGCHCSIASEVIGQATNASSLKTFCSANGDYSKCPVWRRHREEWWKQQEQQLRADLALTAPKGER